MHTLIVFLSIIGGLQLFGILGITVFFIEPSWGIGCFVLAALCGLAPALRR